MSDANIQPDIDCIHFVNYIDRSGKFGACFCLLESSGTGFDINVDCPISECPCKIIPGVRSS